jgi:hypothetical protein
MPKPEVFSERKSSSMMTMGKRNFMLALWALVGQKLDRSEVVK